MRSPVPEPIGETRERNGKMQVKTIYMVKKDAAAPMSRSNWKIMNSADFERFKMTREGQRRLSAFAELDPYGDCKPAIVAECGTFCADQWRREKKQWEDMEKIRRFREARSATVRRRTVAIRRDLGDGNVPENPYADIERYLIWKELRDALTEGLRRLTEEQREVLRELYIRSPGRTEEELAQELGISRATVNCRKRGALRRMRRYLEKYRETVPERPA